MKRGLQVIPEFRFQACRPAVLVLALMLASYAWAYYEPRPVIRLSEVLTSRQAQSVYHRVEDIELDGRFFRFRVDSEVGQYDITSMALFRKRIQEIATLAQAASQFQSRDTGLDGEPNEQFSIRADSAIDIISRPVESAADLAGQFADNLNETLTGEPAEQAALAYRARESTDPVAAMHKRNIASQWGLDVYSSNLNVQEYLNTVARARSAGRISAGTPTLRSRISRPLGAADIEIEAETALLLKNRSVEELRRRNRELLQQMKINSELADGFLDHRVFSPTHKTRIVHYLAALDGVRNRSAFIEAALEVHNEVMAMAFDNTAMMLQHYHDEIMVLEKLFAGNEMLEAIGRDRRIAYFVPVDMIYWSEQTEALFDALILRAEKTGFLTWELVTAGSLTEEAARQLRARDFVLRENFISQ